MKIVRWAAIAVTALFVLMNLGAAVDPEQADWVQVVGGVLAAAGMSAVLGLGFRRTWGRPAVIAVGALNVLTAVVAIVRDIEGGVIGVVVGSLGAILGMLSGDADHRADERVRGLP